MNILKKLKEKGMPTNSKIRSSKFHTVNYNFSSCLFQNKNILILGQHKLKKQKRNAILSFVGLKENKILGKLFIPN